MHQDQFLSIIPVRGTAFSFIFKISRMIRGAKHTEPLFLDNHPLSLPSAFPPISQICPSMSSDGSAPQPFRIFVGYDAREDVAFQVCRHSLLKHSSIPLEIRPIRQSELRSAGHYWRERGPTESTEFSFTRFLTPYLAGFTGWAMFVDCDFLYLSDIQNLVSLIDDRYAVVCVKHDYTPKETTKMDGAVQTVYPRKNWSSMVLYNCAHPKNKVLTPETVSSQTGTFLHRFAWLEDDEIGEVPFVWNFLVGHNVVDPEDPSTRPCAIHYTTGGPWFERYKDCEFADLWLKELDEHEKEKEKKGDEKEKVVKEGKKEENGVAAPAV